MLLRELTFKVFHQNFGNTFSATELLTLFLFSLKIFGDDFNRRSLATGLQQVAVFLKDKAKIIYNFDF